MSYENKPNQDGESSGLYSNGCLPAAIAFAVICFSFGGCEMMSNYKFNKNSPQPQLQQSDLNGNNKQDEFYTLEGKTAVTEVDGELILDYLRRQQE
tara:strand:+ start:249 stop:536 length:288 start_codon:yes stop_codon:yes gene_type:complete